MDVVSVTGECRIFLDADLDVKVAVLSAVDASFAFAFDADLLAVIDAGWDIDVKVFVDAVVTTASTGFAWVFDNLACTVTMFAWTFGLHGAKEGSLGMQSVAATATIWAG